jgi:hypothetical protein
VSTEPTPKAAGPRPTGGELFIVELNGVLANPRSTVEIAHLIEAIGSIAAGPAADRMADPGRRRQGEILRAIRLVLDSEPCVLRPVEIRRLVEQHLGHRVAASTVRDALCANSETPTSIF